MLKVTFMPRIEIGEFPQMSPSPAISPFWFIKMMKIPTILRIHFLDNEVLSLFSKLVDKILIEAAVGFLFFFNLLAQFRISPFILDFVGIFSFNF